MVSGTINREITFVDFLFSVNKKSLSAKCERGAN